MGLKKLIVLAALLPLGCGGSPEPASSQAETQAPSADVQAQSAPESAAAQPAARDTAQPATADTAEPAESVQLAQADAADLDTSRFQEGTHYQRLSPAQPTSTGPGQVEVAEFFMYSCVHCYNFEPFIEEWEADLPDYVAFVRVPTVWNPVVRLHGQAFYTAQTLDKLDEMHGDFFREMHVQGNFLETEAALADFFAQYGVDQEQFESTFDSFDVHTKVQRADELARRYRVTSTPTVVVNGKYVTNASMTGGYDVLLELIDELAASERAGE